MKYFPLKVHTDVSLLTSPTKSKDITKRLKELELDGCAITDFNSLSGVVDFTSSMKDASKKPIIGTILNICSENAKVKETSNLNTYELTLLAKNEQGWKNLVKLVSLSNRPENFHEKPRLSLEQIKPYLNNLIGLSGSADTTLSNCINEYGIPGGINCAKILRDCFDKDSFYLEICLCDDQDIILSDKIRTISARTGIPAVAVTNSFYTDRDKVELQRILLCSNLGVSLGDSWNNDFLKFKVNDTYYIPSYQEMLDIGFTDKELAATVEIADKIESYSITRSPMLKEFECPNGYTPDTYLHKLCQDGYKKLLAGKLNEEEKKIYGDRAKYELQVILDAGLPSYFLIVADILNYCHKNDWLVGPGRGSAAGCLISYLIGITKLDPIKHDLLFERFYNAGRGSDGSISLPDIDIDIPTQYRDTLIEYVKNKYGSDNVAQMITYQTMKGSKALKEVFRAYDDVSFDEINRMTKNIVQEAKIADQLQHMKEETGESSIIRWCLENNPKDFEDWAMIEDGKIVGPYADRFEKAIALEGTKSAISRHPAGIIICPERLDNICPLIYDAKQNQDVVALEMEDAEKCGLMKLDLLGVSILDKVMKVRELLKRRGIDFDGDICNIDMEDSSTWDLISDGNTKGVFQLESQLGQSMAKKLKPRNIDHLAALTAILRPGCLESQMEDGKSITEHYMMRKNGQEQVEYIHDALKPMLKNAYGVMIYQEQALIIGQKIAGMSLSDADKYIRKGIGKKKPELIAKAKVLFLEGCKETKIVPDDIAEMIFSWIEKSQRYSFNASHSYAYAYNAYLTAYCKANYPLEFFCAYLYYADEKPKPLQEVYELINNAKSFDIYVMPPDLLLGNMRFDIIDGSIYYGLSDIKNVGESELAKLDIESIRKVGWTDFLVHHSPILNKRAKESLVSAGALDKLGTSRRQMLMELSILDSLTDKERTFLQVKCPGKTLLERLNNLVASGTGRGKGCSNAARQMKIASMAETLRTTPFDLKDYIHEVANAEKALLGVCLTMNHVQESTDRYAANCTCEEFNSGFQTNVGVIIMAVEINNVRITKTKRGATPGQEMAFLEASDETGSANGLVIFPNAWEDCKDLCHVGNTVLLIGQRTKDKNSLSISEIVQI